jgi:hypothetical protein
MHTVALASEKLPAAQSEQLVALAAEYWPATQILH